jgi:uncharacterized protein YecT (DUF1311 family)
LYQVLNKSQVRYTNCSNKPGNDDMRIAVSALSLSLLVASTACAQKDDGQPETGPEPILSATNTIATCFMDHSSPSERREICPGQYIENCIALRPGADTTVGMITCAREELEAWQVILDQNLASLAGTGRSDLMRTSFEDAQSSWLAHRDAQCRYEASAYEGGTMAGVVSTACFSAMTAQRALRVAALFYEMDAH